MASCELNRMPRHVLAFWSKALASHATKTSTLGAMQEIGLGIHHSKKDQGEGPFGQSQASLLKRNSQT